MTIFFIVLGIALIIFGALVLIRFGDRAGGSLKWLGIEVSSGGAGLPIIALGIGCLVFASRLDHREAEDQLQTAPPLAPITLQAVPQRKAGPQVDPPAGASRLDTIRGIVARELNVDPASIVPATELHTQNNNFGDFTCLEVVLAIDSVFKTHLPDDHIECRSVSLNDLVVALDRASPRP